ncbi:AraC family transcriptional regulator [Nocardia cyriacigeorgica]|uniref:AraC family transcriptional regulator n=2 Tax=Nocardia cyriacigeorgica TaxID=135487 RepID=UPI001894E05C|nr:helix-turn-helix domain-containing protein [Nocardia cyriacigeorgica]MBF6452990.1 AraC family transcriptional regulator [Nocardia cyriacigeorgica]MBF6480375.1 AraC family transcriptional regulator [Nocardia cyriacigeorgica]MBF6550159.1 AraC family transcriptional regulator [Nocardia cyriacigeorgica]
MRAELAGAVGIYREQPMSIGPFGWAWVHRMPDQRSVPVLITPDATIDVQWIDGGLRVAGPDREPQTEVLAAGATVCGLRFRPATASAWLGVPASELMGQRVDLAEFLGARARRLAGRVDATSAEATIASLARLLAVERDSRTTDPAMLAAYRLIERGTPPQAQLIPFLGRALGLSERTLRRRFDESFGYGPKTLDRILRFQRFRRLTAAAPGTSIAELAAAAGYSDQPHLIRESRKLTAHTPAELVAGRPAAG